MCELVHTTSTADGFRFVSEGDGSGIGRGETLFWTVLMLGFSTFRRNLKRPQTLFEDNIKPGDRETL
jgi:hypothetical protein